MGFAIASEAARRGARVSLVAGPTSLDPPPVHELVRVRTAGEMHAAVMERASGMQVVVMAAAVADYAPVETAVQKVPKGGDTLMLTLKKTPDILADLGRQRLASGSGPVLVGFAAETEGLVGRATAKLNAKHADLIVANDVSRTDSGFSVENNEVTIVSAEGVEALPLQSKTRVAAALLDRVEKLVAASPARRRS
jgi:phosphopantothenoylcysteine decarboxylase/phosphopantothenate--cysteine ligase